MVAVERQEVQDAFHRNRAALFAPSEPGLCRGYERTFSAGGLGGCELVRTGLARSGRAETGSLLLGWCRGVGRAGEKAGSAPGRRSPGQRPLHPAP